MFGWVDQLPQRPGECVSRFGFLAVYRGVPPIPDPRLQFPESLIPDPELRNRVPIRDSGWGPGISDRD